MGLAELGFKVGDLVAYDSDDESTGGVVFRIIKNCDPVTPHGMMAVQRRGYGHNNVPVDSRGKKIPAMEINGYVRLKPIFSFFPTTRGKKPLGLNQTVLVYHNVLRQDRQKCQVTKVDMLTLAGKYAELGNLVRDLAVLGGMDVGSVDSPPEAHEKTDKA